MKVGVLGGGQLGQMLALAGYPLGLVTSCLDPSSDAPAGLVSSVTTVDMQDAQAVRQWATDCDVLTYEFENVPVALVADLAETKPVRPDIRALAAAQDRWQEKRLLDSLHIPITPFRLAHTDHDIDRALDELGSPVVIKSRTGGYDGKAQILLHDADDRAATRLLMSQGDVVIEQFVSFRSETSIIGVRSLSGEIATYPVVANKHRRGILYKSVAPASLSPALQRDADTYIRSLLENLDYVGTLALEMFELEGRMLANEFAPRVHNSGHWTIEGAETSQFENHLRAITGLPLGSTALVGFSAMVNLVGALPSVSDVLSVEGAHLHLYGKSLRPGRKVGHVTVTGKDKTTLLSRLESVEKLINNVLPTDS